MSDSRDRRPACGFCDGTGLWVDPTAGPDASDPCPLCDGAGTMQATPPPVTATPTDDPPTVADVVAMLDRLTQAERQEVYELLHARYDCRIYRR